MNKSGLARLDLINKKLLKDGADLLLLLEKGFLLFYDLEKPSEAASAIIKAIKLDKKNIHARFLLANVYYNGYGDVYKAKDVLEEALEIDKNGVECIALLAEILFFLTQNRIVSFLKAIIYMKRAIKIEPYWIGQRIRFANILAEFGFSGMAENILNDGLRLDEIGLVFKPKYLFMDEFYKLHVTGIGHYTKNDLSSLLRDLRVSREKSFFHRIFHWIYSFFKKFLFWRR
ncbi:tetratricopeptide repeat protein [Candidatus Dependentiae bacterium]